MRLTELNPKWTDGQDGTRYLDFLCPAQHKVWPEDPESQMACTIMLPAKGTGSYQESGWTITDPDDFERITVTPSIWHHCKKDPHFFITNGEIVFA